MAPPFPYDTVDEWFADIVREQPADPATWEAMATRFRTMATADSTPPQWQRVLARMVQMIETRAARLG